MAVKSIEKQIKVPFPPSKAFDIFVDNINAWWPKEYTWSQQHLQEIKIEGRINGLCTELGPYDFRCDWGRVTTFENAKSISFKWQISPQRIPEPDPERASEVYVKFNAAADNETLLELTHQEFENHGNGAEDYRNALDAKEGWTYILDKYANYCKSESGSY